ncbi:hypothetical protein [Myxococcus hansupus]|uniref:hypothetical protein n=1 Tax=Pseudomyxococcus hansupus TaxID=1297742 RepID=UPI001D04883D|nr:hypothetical protein [Myxococcus hansupus]
MTVFKDNVKDSSGGADAERRRKKLASVEEGSGKSNGDMALPGQEVEQRRERGV